METQVISNPGHSNLCTDYDSVEYLDRSGNSIYTARITYSDRLKNGFLGMMNADFTESTSSDNKDTDIGSLISLKDVPPEWEDPISIIESLASVSMMQFSKEDPTYNYEVYSYIEKSKLTILRLPKNCTALRLFNTTSSDEYLIDLINDKKVPSANGLVEKMVILSVARTTQDNFSPKIHNALDIPHSLLKDKILLSTHFYDTIALFEVDKDKLMDTKGNVRLGDYLVDYDSIEGVDNLVLDIDDNTGSIKGIIVNNKVVRCQ